MRIALFAETFLPKTDGITNTLCQLLEHLGRRGHQSVMFAPEGAPATVSQTTIHGLPALPLVFYPELRLVPPAFNVEQQLRAFGPDLVHLVNPASLGWVGLRHARALGKPVVASYHTDLPGYAEKYGMPLLTEPLWAYFRWIHNKADLNLCPSNFTLDQLRGRGFERLGLWGRGVDTQRFTPHKRGSYWRNRLSGGHPEASLLLYVGRLAAEKRVDWLRHVMNACPEARLGIVGDGPLRQELAHSLGPRVVFAGYLHGDELARAYAAADLFVFPSASETLGNVVLEAMASGLPVVAAGAGGPVDHVRNGVNGYLFSPERPGDLVTCVKRVLASDETRQRMGANARGYALSQSWQRILDGLLAQYAGLIYRHSRDRDDNQVPLLARTRQPVQEAATIRDHVA